MQFKNLKELFQKFSNEQVCREYLIQQRWGGKPVCPYCENDRKHYVIEKGKRFKCADKSCLKKFSVTVGTIFEDTKIPLSTWFAAIYLVTAHKKGISSLQLHRDLGVTQKTAWFMLHRVREMLKIEAPEMLKNTVEIDETYVGGKEKNKHFVKKGKHAHGRSLTKTPVIGMVERGGNVYAKKMTEANHENVLPSIYNSVDQSAIVMTDSWPSYLILSRYYNHHTIDHSRGKYVDGDIHTNTIEGFWSLLKRGIIGIYHSISYKHMNAYCTEFSYRYNTRKLTDPQRFHASLTMVNGKRIKYKRLTDRFYVE